MRESTREAIDNLALAIPALRDLTEISDGMNAAEALEVLDELLTVKRHLDAAISLVKSQAVKVLEQPAQIGDTIWFRQEAGKWRPDARRINAAVKEQAAIDMETGEIRDGLEAAETAIALMRALYVSPSSMPKTGGLEQMNLTKKDVATWERTGWELGSKEVKVVDAD